MNSGLYGQPICVDLFCGAGGLSDGLRQAGFRPVLGVDLDESCVASYQANHPEAIALQRDITRLTGKEVLKYCGGRDVDLLAGGPSCQGYSTHGKRKAGDPRNFLFEHFVRIAAEIQPKWILIENVQGLLTFSKGYFRDRILDSLKKIGYSSVVQLINTADYGVPQLRRRIIFLATRTNVAPSLPEPTHGVGEDMFSRHLRPYVTVNDALSDLPLLGRRLDDDESDYVSPPKSAFQRYVRQYSPKLTLHQANMLSEQAQALAKFIKEGYGLRDVPVKHLPQRFKKMRRISNGALRRDCTTLYHRLDRGKPAYTITCYFRNVASGPFMHPLEDRSLSFREAARLMSFQDRYRFEGVGIARQIGNAVPPLLAKTLGKHIIGLLSKEHFSAYRKRAVA